MPSEMHRLEQATDLVLEALRTADRPLTFTQLKRLVRKQSGEDLREGDLRGAVWLIVDGGRAKFVDGKVITTDKILTDLELLEEDGWFVECESPLEIHLVENPESRATGAAAQLILEMIRRCRS